jgi:sugar phosphate permease
MTPPPFVSPSSARWIVPIVLSVSLYIAFIDRMNLSLAMPQIAETYGWSDEEIGDKGGLLLGSFYLSYGLSNLILSAFAARIGPRRSLLILVAAFSFFTILGAPLSFSLALFIGTRVMLGLGEGVHFPMMNAVTKHWFPPHERSRANAIWVFGSTFALVTMPLVLIPVIETYGWRTMLVGCGLLGGLITIPLLYVFVFDKPEDAPWVPTVEVAYIAEHMERDAPVPANWSFLNSPIFWLATLGAILNNYCIYGIMNWLPIYFVKARGIDFAELTYAASLPYVAGFVSFILYAFLGDRTNRRISLAGFGFWGATISIFLATIAPTVPLTILAFSAGTFFQTAYVSQEFAILQRLLPGEIIGKAAGVYQGFSVLIGALGGTVLLGQIVNWTGSYDAGIHSVVVATILGGIVMFVLSRFVKY